MVREEAHVVVGPWVSLSRTPRAVAKRITELRLRRTVAAPVRDPSGFGPVEPVVADPGARRRVRPLADLQLQRRRVAPVTELPKASITDPLFKPADPGGDPFSGGLGFLPAHLTFRAWDPKHVVDVLGPSGYSEGCSFLAPPP